MVTEELAPDIRERIHAAIEENPSIMPGQLARTCGVSEAAVLTALPEEMRAFAPKEAFDTVWEEITGWEKITFICQAKSCIVEYKGTLPKGRHGHGFFNLMEKGHPLGGHLMVATLDAIVFLSKPFFGLESHSVQFLDGQGNTMFAIYAGREKRQIIPSVKEKFMALKKSSCREVQ